METLESIGRRHGTDKVTNGYLPRYAEFLDAVRLSTKLVLEVGIAGGASLRMWQSFFPYALVIGVDHNSDYCNVEGPRIKCICADATKPEVWQQLWSEYGPKFDILVDDGFHTTADIVTTYRMAFNLLRPGGIYAIEDLHAAYDPLYNRDNHHLTVEPPIKNAVEYLAGLVNVVNEHGVPNSGVQVKSHIESLHFYKSLAIIRKR